MTALLTAKLRRLVEELGTTGVLSLALFAAATLFLLGVLNPLEERARTLDERLARAGHAPVQGDARPSTAAAKIAAFYRFFDTGQQPSDWLKRLDDIAAKAGLELRSADYQMQRPAGRLERYEIALPVSATYPQLRAFLRTSLAEIPVMSLDQVVIKRQRASDGQIQADIHITLHMVKP
jgi:hypothetical protein